EFRRVLFRSRPPRAFSYLRSQYILRGSSSPLYWKPPPRSPFVSLPRKTTSAGKYQTQSAHTLSSLHATLSKCPSLCGRQYLLGSSASAGAHLLSENTRIGTP